MSLSGLSHEYFELGIGPLNAAKSAKELSERCLDRQVIYIGSCGSFYPFSEPHLVSVDRILWLPTAERLGLAQPPEWLYPPIELQEVMDFSLPRKTLACAPSVSLNGEILISSPLIDRNRLIENMEAYACAEALKNARSLSIIMGVTNQVGPMGRLQWRENYLRIAQMTAEFVMMKILNKSNAFMEYKYTGNRDRRRFFLTSL